MYNAIIVGAGPAGLATALALRADGGHRKVALIEVGHRQSRRPCPVDAGRSCRGCGGTCNVISGFGGCMHYGDGVKLSLLPSGRRLMDLFGVDRAHRLSDRAFAVFTGYLGGPVQLRGSVIPPTIKANFDRYGLDIRAYPVAALAESQLGTVIDGMWEDLRKSTEVLVDTNVVDVRRVDDHFEVEVAGRGGRGARQVLTAHSVVLATGRRGLVDTQEILRRLQVGMRPPSPSLGVRFEMRASLLEQAGLGHPDLKVSRKGEKAKTKSFCFCGGSNGGRIKYTNYQTAFGDEIITLDGHETLERTPHGDRELAGNFGLMCQLPPSGPVTDAETQDALFGRYRKIAGGRPIGQRLRTFIERRDEPMSWDDLSRALPFESSVDDLVTGPVFALLTKEQHASIVQGFRELMLPIMATAGEHPDVSALLDEVVVLGLEAEFLWNQVEVDEHTRTDLPGLYVVGDAAGYAQGIIQGMMTGFAAGDRIAANTVTVAESLVG